MNFTFDNERPINLQLLEQLRTAIVAGTFTPGEKLPSVRELALAAKVNPNTVQKALFQLESEGLIYTERTNGKFVNENGKAIQKTKEALAAQMAARYFNEMKRIGYSDAEALAYITQFGGAKQ